MRNYIDPEMNIALFDAENVVTEASAITQAKDFFSENTAGANGNTDLTAGAVAAGNVLTFTF